MNSFKRDNLLQFWYKNNNFKSFSFFPGKKKNKYVHIYMHIVNILLVCQGLGFLNQIYLFNDNYGTCMEEGRGKGVN